MPLDAGSLTALRQSKVPEVTLVFWIIKITATTLGETGGDTLSMTLNLGYALSTAIFFPLFFISVFAQIRAKGFNKYLYWFVIVTTTTVGTTIADFCDRSLGIGYLGGSMILFSAVLITLGLWWVTQGSVSVDKIVSHKVEAFYWATILFSNTLGTALGDATSDDSGLGYVGSAIFFSGILLVLAAAYFFTKTSRVFLFWAAFILTRPLGATLGDFLTKPIAHGGLDLSRIASTTTLAVFMLLCITLVSQKAKGVAPEPGQPLL